MEYRHIVELGEEGTRLDAFLVRLHPELSRSRIQGLIAEGHVQLERGSAKPARLLRSGDVVGLTVPAPTPSKLEPENVPLDILLEDAAILVLNKPAGMVVHPGAGQRAGTLVNALLAHCSDLQGVGGELRPGIVHRLDKDTTGCLVVAKSQPALIALQESFKRRRVLKTYVAIVHGRPPDEGKFQTLHGRHPTDRKRFSGKVKSGREAITHFRVKERFESAALVEVTLETGRTHQIRVHFSEAGNPLLGDTLYGGNRRETRHRDESLRRASRALGRQALHARRLEFPHPVTGKQVRAEAPIPADFQEALALLRADTSRRG